MFWLINWSGEDTIGYLLTFLLPSRWEEGHQATESIKEEQMSDSEEHPR